MKTKAIFLSAIAVLSVACQKEQPVAPVQEGISIFANAENIKTTLNPDWTVSWTSADDLTIFNAEAGATTYSDNCKFLNSDPATGKFVKDPAETTKSLISGKESYDWYACYPWMQYAANPGATKGYTVAINPQQIGYNTTTAVTGYDLLAGTQKGVAAGTSPNLKMKHVCTLFKFTITNNAGAPAAITGLTLDATDGASYITGSFTMDWDNLKLDASQMGSSKAYTCKLSVMKNAGTDEEPVYEPMDTTIAEGASVDLYFVTAPFSVASGKSIKLTINGSLGDLVLTKTMSSAMNFAAGSYNTAALSYTKPEFVVFTETFGDNTVATGNVPNYNKAGLTTLVPAHAANYTYAVTGNASFAALTKTNKINNPDYVGKYLNGAGVKMPASSATADNSAIYIKNITVEKNTTYIFKYNKSKGSESNTEFTSTTVFKYRQSGTTEWSTVNATEAAGTVIQEFQTGEYTTLDLGVEATTRIPSGTITYFPALDYFQLIKK